MRPSRLPYLVGALVVVALVGLFYSKPWESSPAEGREPNGGGGQLAVVPDAGPVQLVLGETPDSGEELAANEPDAGAGETAEEEPVDGGAKVAIHVKQHPKDERGKLNVVTLHAGEPYWAQVSIDGKPKGRTPLLLDLPAGKYSVRVERTGFRTETREIRVASGRQSMVRIDLEQ